MSDEATLSVSLNIRSGNLQYQSYPSQFRADVDGLLGPTPGAFLASTEGTDVDLSEITTPGLCFVQNIDDTNYVEYGIYDPETDVFYPLGELLPGEAFPLRLSRNLGVEYDGTGTGTTAPTNTFRFKANTADCVVKVEAFER